MCLVSYPKDVKKFKRQKKGLPFFAYKVLLTNFRSPFYNCQYRRNKLFLSNAVAFKPDNETISEIIHAGVHVFTTLEKAKASYMFSGVLKRIIVKVKCLPADIIGVNLDAGQAVLTKVYLGREKKICREEMPAPPLSC